MAYAQYDKITTAEYNSFMTSVREIFGDANSGSASEATANTGYGQPMSYIQKSAGDKISAADWNTLLTYVHACADHQGSNVLLPASITSGEKVTPMTTMAADLATIKTNRLSSSATSHSTAASVKATRTPAWTDTISHTATCTFQGWDHMRYFFNTNGQLRFKASNTGGSSAPGSINLAWSSMLTSISGASMSFGHTSTASSNGNPMPGSSMGLYDLTTSDQQVFSRSGSGAYSDEVYTVSARLNAPATSATQIVFTIQFASGVGGDPADGVLESWLEVVRANNTATVSAPVISMSAIA